MEIERKWVIRGNIEGFDLIFNGWYDTYYLSVNPEIRVREFVQFENGESVHVYLKAVKSGSGLSRVEGEYNISADEYNRLVEKPELIIHGDFWWYRYGKYVLEVTHRDTGRESAFWFLEVEFESEEEALRFELPSEIHGIEVTYLKEFQMVNYWNRTRLGG